MFKTIPKYWLKIALFFNALLLIDCPVYANNIPVVIAGNGLPGFAGDGGPATDAQLYQSSFITGDNAGNIYIADTGNHRVRKIDSNGIITTVAGVDTWGKSGDGGPATDAQLNSPRGLALDANGNLYIVGSSSHRIRKVDTAGIITTAVNGESFLNSMTGLTLDASGNLYIADTGNAVVRKIEPNGKVTTVVGNGQRGSSGDNGPATEASLGAEGLVFDAERNLYVTDIRSFTVRKVDTSGIITTVAGNGAREVHSPHNVPATSVSLSAPNDLAFDSAGNLYISDIAGIRKVDTSGTLFTLVEAPVTDTFGIFIDSSDNLFVVDAYNNVVWRIANVSRMTTADPIPFIGQQIQLKAKTLTSKSQILTFGTIFPSSNNSLKLTIANDSMATSNLTLREVSLVKSPRQFTTTLSDTLPQVLPPGGSFDAELTFSSNFRRTYSTHLRILSDDSTHPIFFIPVKVQSGTESGSSTGSATRATTVSPSGHFMIHYISAGFDAVDLIDTNNNQVPDYIDDVARVYDHVHTVIVDSLGFRPPPYDGDAFYDIHVLDLGAYEAYSKTYPKAQSNTSTPSTIEIDNNFTDAFYTTTGLNGLQIAAANTYFTAVLYGYYNHASSAWLQFLSGTWIEDIIYDNVNDYYRHLNCTQSDCFFSTPTLSLDHNGSNRHPSGAALFGHFLTQKYGIETIRKIWETLSEQKPEQFTLKNLEAGLPEGGFAKLIPEFAIWNYFTGSRARTGYFQEASNYPEMPVQESTPSGTGTIDHLAADYIRIKTNEHLETIKVSFQLDSTAVWTLNILLINSDSVTILTPPNPAVIEISEINRFNEIVFIPVVTSLEGQDFIYTYTLTNQDTSAPNTPNPDFTADNKVDFADFLLFAQHFGKKENQEGYDAKFDLSQDNEVGFQDFLIFAAAFNTTPE